MDTPSAEVLSDRSSDNSLHIAQFLNDMVVGCFDHEGVLCAMVCICERYLADVSIDEMNKPVEWDLASPTGSNRFESPSKRCDKGCFVHWFVQWADTSAAQSPVFLIQNIG